ncbi:MAG: hypothetical protein JNJ57_22195 [Saprospiraceae bacterium]|nr:hypothetical protein [Saprospiraceae bacterium]
MKRIFFLVLTTLVFFCCTAEEKKTYQSANCYVRYDEAQGRVSAEATFNHPESKIAVEVPGGVRFQSNDMKATTTYGHMYRYEETVKFQPEQVFEWGPKNKGASTLKVGIVPIQNFSFGTSEISFGDAVKLTWDGAALGKGETLVFMWENKEKGLTVPLEVSTTIGEPIVEIPGEKMKSISPGNWTLYLVRKKLQKSNVDGIAVNSILEYYTKPIALKIK